MSDTQTGGQFAAAFVAAQAELTNPTKGKTAKIPTKTGGQYSYTYADLAAIIVHVREVLAKFKLAVLQDVVSTDSGGIGIRTTILHESGESMTFGPVSGPGSSDWKDIGSAITYARRYALTAALGISTEDDDDAGRATTPDPRPLSAEAMHAYEQRMDLAANPAELRELSVEVNAYDLEPEQEETLRTAYKARESELRVREPGPAQRATQQRAAESAEEFDARKTQPAAVDPAPERIEYEVILPLLEAVELFDDRTALKVFHDEHEEAGLLDRAWDDSGDTLRKFIEAKASNLKAAGK